MYKTLSLIAFMAMILAGCRKVDVKCHNERYDLVTVGYKFYDIDTLQIKWYKPESGFTELVQEGIFALDPRDLLPRNDTIIVESFHASKPEIPGTLPFTSAYNVEITIPATKATYRIGSVQAEGLTEKRMKRNAEAVCTNHLISYELDSNRHIWQTDFDKFVYLKK
jgi:hypothetical protein